MKNIRLLFVPGIHTPKWYVKWWKKDIHNHFSDIDSIFLDDVVYYYWQHEILEDIVQEGTRILRDGRPTIILAHSFGGILAKSMIARSRGNISFFLTMATPHTMTYVGIHRAKKYISAPETVAVPAESMGGFFDPVVPFFLSRLPGAHRHTNLFCEHMSFLWAPWVRQRVIRHIRENGNSFLGTSNTNST